MTAVGGLGILGDLWSSATFGNVEGFIGGPAVSDLSNFIEGLISAAKGNPKKIVKDVIKKTPILGLQAITGINR